MQLTQRPHVLDRYVCQQLRADRTSIVYHMGDRMTSRNILGRLHGRLGIEQIDLQMLAARISGFPPR
jgi:hypothetical protein